MKKQKKNNIDGVIKEIINKIPSPLEEDFKPFKSLIFGSYYNSYHDVVILVKIKECLIKEDDLIYFMVKKIFSYRSWY